MKQYFFKLCSLILLNIKQEQQFYPPFLDFLQSSLFSLTLGNSLPLLFIDDDMNLESALSEAAAVALATQGRLSGLT